MKSLSAVVLGFAILVPAEVAGGAPYSRITPTPGDGAGTVEPLDWGSPEPAVGLPDFNRSSEVRGPVDAGRWRQATAIIVTEHGFGSGAILSADGWILTNYHVVEEAVQAAAMSGQPRAEVGVITCEIREGRMGRRAETTPARVYRVSPTLDLALVRMERLPAGVTALQSFEIAPLTAKTLDVCYVIGSQGNGPAWMVRKGEIANDSSRYPENMANFVTGIDSAGAPLQRMRASILVSTCPISPGDSGGPLLNEEGQLTGLTFATPSNLSGGATGYHVSADEIRPFITPFPKDPEAAPFDAWTAGIEHAQMGRPQTFTISSPTGKPIGAVLFTFVEETAEGWKPVAMKTYFSFRKTNFDAGTTVRDIVPEGLWEYRSGGQFPVDFGLLARQDSLTAMAYSTGENEVGEIRIDLNADHATDVLWKIDAAGRWIASPHPAGLPLFDSARLDPDLVTYLKRSLAEIPWKK